jgi:hypothetical protein
MFLRPNKGSFHYWLREMEGTISQYNLEKEKHEEREIELAWLREMEGTISAEPGRESQT